VSVKRSEVVVIYKRGSDAFDNEIACSRPLHCNSTAILGSGSSPSTVFQPNAGPVVLIDPAVFARKRKILHPLGSVSGQFYQLVIERWWIG
jgi:hypothetical protein